MGLPENFADVTIRIEYITFKVLSKLQKWAAKNSASVRVSRYAKDAFEGMIVIRSPWNVGQSVIDQRVKEARELISRK